MIAGERWERKREGGTERRGSEQELQRNRKGGGKSKT